MPQPKPKLLEKSLCLSWIRNYGKLNIKEIKNKFRRFGNEYWNESRRQRNNVMKFRKQSLKNYFGNHCKKTWQKLFESHIPLYDKRYRNGNSIILNENDKIVNDPSQVVEFFSTNLSRQLLRTLVLMVKSVLLVMPQVGTKIIPAYRKFNKSSTKLIVISNLVLLLWILQCKVLRILILKRLLYMTTYQVNQSE